MAVSVVSFSFSRAAQPEAQRPTLLGDGFLYCILSATSLDPNSSGAPRTPSAWHSFPYHILSATYLQLSPTQSGAPSLFGLEWLSLPHLVYNSVSNCLTSVLTELYNSSTSTQSLEWHVWSSSSGNNCHAVHRSLSSGASLWNGTFTLSHIISRAHLRDFFQLLAIGMCHFLPVHHFEWHFWPGRRSKYNISSWDWTLILSEIFLLLLISHSPCILIKLMPSAH